MIPAPARLRQLAGLVLDCDGVLSDGGLYFDAAGGRQLRFNARDGFALALLSRAGLPIGVLSGRPADIAEARHAQLGMGPFVGGCHDKAVGLKEICAAWGCAPEAVAFVGDDLPDLPAFSAAGLCIAVGDAAPEVRTAAHWITRAHGGHGAVREVCEAIARARGDWPTDIAQPAPSAPAGFLP